MPQKRENLEMNGKSASFAIPSTQRRRAGLSTTDSSVSTMSMLRRSSSDIGGNKVTGAALFGALKFKGLLNVRLRARRARLGTLGTDGHNHVGHEKRRASQPTLSLLGSKDSRQNENGNYGSIEKFSSLGISREEEDEQHEELEDLTFKTDVSAVKDLLFGNKVCIFLLCIPFGAFAKFNNWGDSAIFGFNFLAILPLAQLLGDFTEEVALYTNDTIGGLLNATLGNATELIISIFAIQKNLLRVVQVSLLGSVLSNELLVTGCCFLFGGLYHKEQHFNSHIASIDSSLLLMAVLGLSIPAAFSSTMQSDCHVDCKVGNIIEISHATAIMLFFLYAMLLVFQLKTHTHLMDAAHSHNQQQQVHVEPDHHQRQQKPNGLKGSISTTPSTTASCDSISSELDDEQDPEEATMTLKGAICMLGVTTLLVAWCSELLVDSIEQVSVEWGLSKVFIGLILLPIIGNAAEHATAITVAIKGKMDLALGVALGSSVQIALCVVPALCVVGWIMDKPLTLDFHPFETIVLVVSVLVVTSTVRQGTSTWLEGIMLIISYCIIGLAYYYRKERPLTDEPACLCGEACCWADSKVVSP